MEIRHLNQKQLAERWQISEASLERWRSENLAQIISSCMVGSYTDNKTSKHSSRAA